MKRIELLRWAAWAPGIATQEQWQAWARAPEALCGGGAPDVRFLPALQRRRCDPLSRSMLEVAHACCPEPLLAEVACVFATRHGPLETTLGLLRDLAAHAPLSPARFAHSVHNAPAGLVSIYARNPQPSSTLAGGADTFACGFLEAVTMLHRVPGRQALLVVADELVPEPLGALAERLDSAYAVAFLLGVGGGQGSLQLRLEPGQGSAPSGAWPDALEFLRWWIAGEPELRLARGPLTWVWSRHE